MTFYRALLRLYPAAFRDEYGQQMRLLFAEQLSEARENGGFARQATLWVEAMFDAFTIGPAEHVHVIFKDLRYALRDMSARPGFAIVAILSLALGTGANTAIFSLWEGLLHASLPAVHKPEQLAILSNPGSAGMSRGDTSENRHLLTYAEFENLRDHAQSFSGLMASQSGLATWQVRLPGGAWEAAQERLVSGGYFQVLGVQSAIGQLFTANDDRTAIPHAVISYDYWQRRFGGRADALGRNVSIATLPAFYTPAVVPHATVTIAGVAARGFIGETAGQQPDFWIPLRMQTIIVPSIDGLHDTPPEKIAWLHVFGRLRPGVTLTRADSEANMIFKAGLASFYGSVASAQRRGELLNQHLKVQSGSRGASATRNDFSTSLTALLSAVALLLLIACANLANLQLARGAARRPEIALRLSLGASHSRLVRQLMTESLLLASLGSLTGFGIAYLLHGALVRMVVQADRTFSMNFRLSPLMLLFTLAVTLAAALLFGLLPAWQATRTDTAACLKEKGENAIGRANWGRKLVSLQLAFSLPLLVGAGLLARTLYNLQHTDLGFSVGHLLLVRIDLHDQTTFSNTRRSHLLSELLSQLRRMPGVSAASFSGLGLFSGDESISTMEAAGSAQTSMVSREVEMDRVGPGYFSTLGIPMTLGREILERDRENTPKVCVVNRAFAERYFPGRNPLGVRITTIGAGMQRSEYQVIGVAGNARTQSLRQKPEPRCFIAQQQDLSSVDMPEFLIRATTGSAPVLQGLRQVFQHVDASLPINSAKSLEEQLAPSTAQDRTTAQLAVVFGSVALALAAVGLYGLLSYAVARRRREIAIRIAVGAKPGRVVVMILGESGRPILTGLAAGACLTYSALLLIHSRLYGVAPQDPVTLALATVLLLLVAFVAAYLPARRASKLDPMESLRRE